MRGMYEAELCKGNAWKREDYTQHNCRWGSKESIVSAMYIHEGHTTHLQVGIQREKLKGQPLQVMGIYTTYDSARERSSESTIEEE